MPALVRPSWLPSFAAVLLTLGAAVPASAALDLVGTWKGTATCKDVTSGAVAKPKRAVTLTITQTGNDLTAAIASATYLGHAQELAQKLGQGAATLVTCSTQAGGTAFSEVLSLAAKVKPSDPTKATLKGTSSYENAGASQVGGTCRYAFKRTDLADPGVAPCTFAPVCGNGTVEGVESCDGVNLHGSSCTHAGFVGGTLACTAGCAFDTSGCVVDPAATDHTFVISAIDLPTSGAESLALGFDLDGKPNDGVDNQLGSVLASLGALSPSLDLQAAMNRQVDQGLFVLLVDVESTDLGNAGASLSLYAGTTVMTPAACSDPSDVVCRQQFAGTGAFNVDPLTPPAAKLKGSIASGQFNGGPGTISLRLTLGGATLSVPLHAARVQLAGLGADGWSTSGSKLGGAIAESDVTASVQPWIANLVRAAFDTDCDVGGTPPSCGCVAASTGATFRNLFDKAPTQDCTLSDSEVASVIGAFLTPDVDLDGDGTNDALSLGVGVTGVAGSFTVP